MNQTKTIGIYGHDKDPAFRAAIRGIRRAGHEPKPMNASGFQAHRPERSLDGIFVAAHYRFSPDIFRCYDALKIPCFGLFDPAFRGAGKYRLGRPEVSIDALPEDVETINLNIKSPRKRVKNNHVLILGDPNAHSSAKEQADWAEAIARIVKASFGDPKVVWRPIGGGFPADGTEYSDDSKVEFADALKGAFLVVGQTSPDLLSAAVEGYSVAVDDPSSTFGDLFVQVDNISEFAPADPEALTSFVSRLASVHCSVKDLSKSDFMISLFGEPFEDEEDDEDEEPEETEAPADGAEGDAGEGEGEGSGEGGEPDGDEADGDTGEGEPEFDVDGAKVDELRAFLTERGVDIPDSSLKKDLQELAREALAASDAGDDGKTE